MTYYQACHTRNFIASITDQHTVKTYANKFIAQYNSLLLSVVQAYDAQFARRVNLRGNKHIIHNIQYTNNTIPHP